MLLTMLHGQPQTVAALAAFVVGAILGATAWDQTRSDWSLSDWAALIGAAVTVIGAVGIAVWQRTTSLAARRNMLVAHVDELARLATVANEVLGTWRPGRSSTNLKSIADRVEEVLKDTDAAIREHAAHMHPSETSSITRFVRRIKDARLHAALAHLALSNGDEDLCARRLHYAILYFDMAANAGRSIVDHYSREA